MASSAIKSSLTAGTCYGYIEIPIISTLSCVHPGTLATLDADESLPQVYRLSFLWYVSPSGLVYKKYYLYWSYCNYILKIQINLITVITIACIDRKVICGKNDIFHKIFSVFSLGIYAICLKRQRDMDW